MRANIALILICLCVLSECSDSDGKAEENGNKQTESDSTSITETPSFVKPEEPPKYFGIDIDGTFYTGNEEAWEKNVEAFAEVRKKGYTPFFCTSKNLMQIRYGVSSMG